MNEKRSTGSPLKFWLWVGLWIGLAALVLGVIHHELQHQADLDKKALDAQIRNATGAPPR